MIRADMLQKKVESMTVVLMAKMTQFVKKDIILKDCRKGHDLKIEVDVALCRTTSPIAHIVLDGHAVIDKSVP